MMVNPRIIKILRTVASVTGLLLFIYVLLLLAVHFFLVKKLVPDEYVRFLYVNHKDEVEKLKTMCLEDKIKAGSTFSYFAISVGATQACVRLVGSAVRCQEYEGLFAATKVALVSWQEGCVWLYVDGWGISGKGVRKGLMWRATPMPHTELRQRYVPIEDGWYIFEISVRRPLFVTRDLEYPAPPY